VHRHQQLADLHLTGLDRALHLRLLDERVLGVDDNLELAVGRRLHLVDELHDVAGEVIPLVRADRHVPLLGESGSAYRDARQ